MVKPYLKFVLLSAVLLSAPIANAQPGGTNPGDSSGLGSNAGQGPGAGIPGGGRRHMGGGGYHHMPIPTREQIMALPTLSPKQRQGIEAIYMKSAQTIRPLIAQLRQLSGGGPGAGSPGGTTGGGSPDSRMQLVQQIRQERRSTWEAVKTKLTPDQISQLLQQTSSQAATQGLGTSQ